MDAEYETHLTVAAGDPALAGWKAVRIELSRGASPVQPMLTCRGRENLPDAEAVAARAVAELRRAGFVVVRLKIEAAPGNPEVPAADADAADDPPERYFEHHVKVVVPAAADLAPLAAVAERHAARLSRNPRRVRADGRAEWFVTQRCRRVGRHTAGAALGRLVGELTEAGYAVFEVEAEYVVRDSNLALDAGWLDPGDPS